MCGARAYKRAIEAAKHEYLELGMYCVVDARRAYVARDARTVVRMERRPTATAARRAATRVHCISRTQLGSLKGQRAIPC